MAETIITKASHQLLLEYITNVPDIPNMKESTIEELLCEVSLLNRKTKRPNPSTQQSLPKHKKQNKTTTLSGAAAASSSSTATSTAHALISSSDTNTISVNPKNGISSKGKDN